MADGIIMWILESQRVKLADPSKKKKTKLIIKITSERRGGVNIIISPSSTKIKNYNE